MPLSAARHGDRLVKLFLPTLRLLICAAIGLSVYGCSREPKLDACAMLSKTDVEAILGERVDDPQPGNNTPGTKDTAAVSECKYETAGKPPKRVSLLARVSPVADNTPEAINQVRETLKKTGIAPLDIKDLGDVAFWGRNQLNVFIGGNRYLIISVSGFDNDSAALKKAKALAQKALAAP